MTQLIIEITLVLAAIVGVGEIAYTLGWNRCFKRERKLAWDEIDKAAAQGRKIGYQQAAFELAQLAEKMRK